MRLLLSEPLPLRTSRMLGDFADDFVLPHRYGDLTAAPFLLRRIDDSTFFVADHPAEVTAVFVDGQETAGFERGTESDAEGHTWTVVRLAAPAPAEAVISACGRGKLNPLTGALIENPADIMADVLRIAGRSEIFPQLRAESAAAGLVLAGSVGAEGSEAPSIRAALDAIAASAGAIWTAAGARLYPTGDVRGPVFELDKMPAGELQVSQTLDDTADVLRLTFDESDAVGGALQYLELTASPQRFGGVVAERSFPLLRSPAAAEAVGRRVLRRMAGRRYDVEFAVERIDLRPGTWVRLVGLPEWPTPDADPLVMVLEADLAPMTRSARLRGEAVLSEPLITVTARSIAVPTASTAGVEISVRDGVATLRIVDEDRRPVKDARVSLDGGPALTTDARGVVKFNVAVSATPVDHELAIEAPGMQPQQIIVRL